LPHTTNQSHLQIPPEFVSSGRYLLIHFRTDDTINWKGFSAAFVLASPDAAPVTQPTAGGTPSYNNRGTKSKSYNKLPVDRSGMIEEDRRQMRGRDHDRDYIAG